MQRYFINAPSSLQLLHELDGCNVLADLSTMSEGDRTVTVYFTSGQTISARIPVKFLSKGWIKRQNEQC
jgi:hypothetical protein